MLDTLWQDLRYALRGLRAKPGFAATVVLTVGLGIGANATMFGIIDRLLFRAPDHVRDPDRVVQIETHQAGDDYSNSSFAYVVYADYRDAPGGGGFSSVAVTSNVTVPLGLGTTASQVPGSLVSASYFTTLGVQPALGRFFLADDDDADHPRAVAVIGYALWQRQFGGRADVLGRQLDVGQNKFTIIGVAPRGFTGIELTETEVWLPVTSPSGLRFNSGPTWTKDRSSNWLRIIARIKPGVSPALAAEQATAVDRAALRQQVAEKPAMAKYVHPDSERVHLLSLIPGRVPKGFTGAVAARNVQVSTLLGIVALIVLVIACANVANLLLVRAFTRQREIAIRLALGVSRARLASQLLVEGLLLATLGGVGALLVTHWASHSVRTLLLGAGAWTTEAVDGRLLGFTAVVTLATGLVTSVVPLLQASRADLTGALKQGTREGGGHHSPLRTTLLIVQAALAIVLLAGAGLFIRSVRNVDALPFGIDLDHVLVAEIAHKSAGLSNADALRLYKEFAERVRHVPGVRSAAIAVGFPMAMNWNVDVDPQGRAAPKLKHNPTQYVVTEQYFATLGIPLLLGRAFTDADRPGTEPVVVINQEMARAYFPNRSPLGECLKIGKRSFGEDPAARDSTPCTTVVGVVGNTVRQDLTEGPVAQFYRPLDQLPDSVTDNTVSFFGYEMAVRTSGDASRFIEPVRRVIQSTAATVPYARIRPMAEMLGMRTRAWELGAKVFTAFGLLALVLAAVGLYSVLAFTIAQRLHEFGVRRALGAQAEDLVRLTLSVGLAPVIGGIGTGVLLALLGGKYVSSLLFDVAPRDPMVLATVCAVLLATGILASVVPAIRATRVDPAAVLRSD